MADIDSKYSRILLEKDTQEKTKEPILKLSTGPFLDQSAVFLDEEKREELVFKYLEFYSLADYFRKDLGHSLVLGGAAYSYPKHYLKTYPDSKLDVVEIDPEMTRIAKKYFHLQDNPRLNIYHQDGRVFLNNTDQKYDAIFVDAYGSSLSAPYQLTTQEAVAEMYEHLNDNGVVLANVISSISGKMGKFLRAEYWTYKSIFPQVYLFPVDYKDKGDVFQNIVIMAIKSDRKLDLTPQDPKFQEYLDHLWQKKVEKDVPIMTDNHAPAEYYILERFDYGL